MSNLHAQPFRCLSPFSLLCHRLLQLPELFCPPHTTNHLALNEPERSEEHPQRRSTQPARWLADLRASHLIHSLRDPGKFLYLRTESQSLPVLRIPASPRLRRRSLLSILYLLSLTGYQTLPSAFLMAQVSSILKESPPRALPSHPSISSLPFHSLRLERALLLSPPLPRLSTRQAGFCFCHALQQL